MKIDHRSFVEDAVVVSECAFNKRFTHSLHVGIDPEMFAVDRDARERASRRGRTGGVEKCVPHKLFHDGGVLMIVVEREICQAVDAALFVDMIQFDLERRTRGALRTDEAFLAKANLWERDPINRHAGVYVSVGAVNRPVFPLFPQCLKQVA